MSLLSRTSLGFGFGVVAVASLGYLAGDAPITETPSAVNGNVGWHTTTQRITINKKPLSNNLIDYNRIKELQLIQEDDLILEIIISAVTKGNLL